MDYKDLNAIGIVRLMLTDGVISVEQAAKYFPELGGSEDEKLRKSTISLLQIARDKGFYETPNAVNKCIEWLEKQGENISLPKFTFDDVLALQFAMVAAKNLQKDKDLYEQLESLHDRVHELYWREKQGEQKPNKNIVETWKNMRLEVYQQASCNRHEPNYSDETTKMFSLNDIDEIIEKMSEQKHIDLVAILKDYFANTPKEQREKDWAELKHLNDVGLDAEIAFGAKDSELQEETYFIHNGFHAEIDGNKVVIKKGENKPLSDEDEKMLNTITNALDRGRLEYVCHTTAKEVINWLKSRIGSEANRTTTKEWSDEDECYINRLITFCENCMVQDSGAKECANWLKELKNRVQS